MIGLTMVMQKTLDMTIVNLNHIVIQDLHIVNQHLLTCLKKERPQSLTVNRIVHNQDRSKTLL